MALTASGTQSDVVVRPVGKATLLNAVGSDSLALLTRELVLNRFEAACLDKRWILPDNFRSRQTGHPHPLWRARVGWMLARTVSRYGRKCSGDLQMLTDGISLAEASRASLTGWVNATQPQHESALPVVWAITPQDARFAATKSG